VSDLLPGLLVLAVGGSIAPPLLLLTILFLGSRRPLPNAGALALGYLTVCAVVGISGLVLFGDAGNTISTVGRVISVAVGALLIVLGLGSLLGSSDPEASPPGWLESIDNSSPARAFALGMALFPLQVKNLAIFVACLNLISIRATGRSLRGVERGARIQLRCRAGRGGRVAPVPADLLRKRCLEQFAKGLTLLQAISRQLSAVSILLLLIAEG
jgi:Sap, sulfolipid-1-addressing protein